NAEPLLAALGFSAKDGGPVSLDRDVRFVHHQFTFVLKACVFAFVGLLILQVIVLLPVLGALVVFLAGVWGAGALAVTAFKAAGGKGFDATSTASAPVPSGT
ncbi:MAG: hypothetical protein Q6M04_04210, partial [Thermostichus sp. BF3_bins_97]